MEVIKRYSIIVAEVKSRLICLRGNLIIKCKNIQPFLSDETVTWITKYEGEKN